MLPQLVLLTGIVHYSYAFSIPALPRLSTFVGASHAQTQQQPLQDTLDAWIEREERIALDKLLANVAPGGRNVKGKGVADGTVIASPSQTAPDYWFQCRYSYALFALYSIDQQNRGPRCSHNHGHCRGHLR